jgi:signal transduction histidine kinase
MKYFTILLLLILGGSKLHGQIDKVDSLKLLLQKMPVDTNRVNMLLQIADVYYFNLPDSSLLYYNAALGLSNNLHYTKGILIALNSGGETNRFLGNYPEALKMQTDALELYRKIKNLRGEITSLTFIGVIYIELGQYQQALQFLLPADRINLQPTITPSKVFTKGNIGLCYNSLAKHDSALHYLREAYGDLANIAHPQLQSFIPLELGKAYAGMQMHDSALHYYYQSLHNSISTNESMNKSRVQQKLAEFYESIGQFDSSLYYARNAYEASEKISRKLAMLESSLFLAKLYQQKNMLDSTLFYTDVSIELKDSLFGREKFRDLQLLMLNEQQHQQQILQEQDQYRNKIKYSVLFVAIGFFLIISLLLFISNRQKQVAKTKVEKAYSELKDTQAQLIHREKMASLGEVTAGIAHEIQNPLNFINNFSEVNTELIEELKNEKLKVKNERDEALENELLNDIAENEKKINHHGKRADAIVKGMLQHSQTNSGQKEPTDINKLADEYFRLCFYGLRAKDKSFNATMETNYDETVGIINIVPQDIGRVILNLINNAFYAVNEKQKAESLKYKAYEPAVSLNTKKINDKVEIKVADNGNGIPQKIVNKIFQPFFTTKPTGQGTGLGLFLSYDIIKAHGGEIKVETKEGEGSEFIIQLPVV